MSFLHPEFLYYMTLPLLIFFAFVLTRKSSQESYFSKAVMDKLRVSANTLSLKVRNWIFLVISLLILVALSGPVINEGTVEVKAKSADIMVAIDISDSMLAEDVYPNRLKLAKQKALELLKLAPNERIGVIAFAKNSYLVSPLSFDANAVAFLLRELNTDSITEKGTNLLSMLKVVDRSIKKKSKKYLLVLTDGGDSKDFSREIAYAKEKNIVVFVLAVGTTKGAPIKREDGSFLKLGGEVLISKLNTNISALATKTGGVYIEAINSKRDVEAMLKEIEAHSEKKELKSKEIKRYIPLFYFPLGLALFLLLVATSSIVRKSKVNAAAVVMLFMTFGLVNEARAGVMDFMLLKDAKEAYETQEYEKAQRLYDRYAQKKKTPESEYNIANTLYKQKKYKEAQEAYKKIQFQEPEKQAKNYANLGNAYVKAKEKEGLQKAITAYEESLKIEEDKEVRENLETVKKALEERKKNEQQKQENKDKKDKQDNKDKKNSDKDKKEQQDKSDKEKKDEQQKNSDKEKDAKDKKSDKKSKERKEEDKAKRDNKEKQEKKKQEENKKDTAKELKDKNDSQAQHAPKDMKNIMSDEEEKKWLKALSKQQSTFLYKLNDDNKFEDKTDEKPW